MLVNVCAPSVLTEPVKIVDAAVDVTDKLLRALLWPTEPPKLTTPVPLEIVKLGAIGLVGIASTAAENVSAPLAVFKV